jgi:hypothetical protein
MGILLGKIGSARGWIWVDAKVIMTITFYNKYKKAMMTKNEC